MTRNSTSPGTPGTPKPPGTPPPAPLPRPTLLPGLRRLWRGRRTLQLGVDPARAVVLELPDASAARLLDLLDGTRSERAVIAEAADRYEVSEADGRALLATLRDAGLVVGAQTLLPHNLPDRVRRRLADEAAALALRGTDTPATPAQILRRRSAARVVVTGHDRVAAPVALALAQSGVGHVHPAAEAAPAPGPGPEPEPVPAGLPRQVARRITQVAPGTRTGPLRRRDTSFVVHAGAAGPANLAAAGYAQHRLAHLSVVVRDGAVLVGPLVAPGGSPCLECLDLHRQDRDPDWPRLAAQLATPDHDPCAAATLLSAAGLAAGEVLSWLDGELPSTLGAIVEVAAPGQLRRRSWPPHPRCRCSRRGGRASGTMHR